MLNINIKSKKFLDFKDFSIIQLDNKDIDPVYPLLKRVYQKEKDDIEIAFWRTILYVTWYNMASGEYIYQLHKTPQSIKKNYALNTGVERRYFRGKGCVKAVELIDDLLRKAEPFGNFKTWIESTALLGGEKGWTATRKNFEKIKGNGLWVSYKWCDLLKNVFDYPITAPDVGSGGMGLRAGPNCGLSLMTEEPLKLCYCDPKVAKEFYKLSVDNGIPFDGLEELETCLCDFNTMSHGAYYPGNDIDVQLQQILHLKTYMKGRTELFKKEYLGEYGGWMGTRLHLKTYYIKTKRIYEPEKNHA